MLKVATKGGGARQTSSRFGDGGVPILPHEPSARTQITLTRFPRNKLGHVIRCHSQPQPEHFLSRPSSSSISKSEYRWLNLVRSGEDPAAARALTARALSSARSSTLRDRVGSPRKESSLEATRRAQSFYVFTSSAGTSSLTIASSPIHALKTPRRMRINKYHPGAINTSSPQGNTQVVASRSVSRRCAALCGMKRHD